MNQVKVPGSHQPSAITKPFRLMCGRLGSADAGTEDDAEDVGEGDGMRLLYRSTAAADAGPYFPP